MNSLQQLNAYANTSITFTDNRAPDVRFNSFNVRDIAVVESSGGAIYLQYPVDIVEVIQPSQANVVYTIEMYTSSVTLVWGTLPGNISIVNAGNKYFVSGIQSASDWNAVKAPQIQAPPEYVGYINYASSISYTRLEGLKTISWEVGTYVPIAFLQTNATLLSTVTRIKSSTVDMVAQSSFELLELLQPMIATTSMTVDGNIEKVIISDPSTITYTTNTEFALTNYSEIVQPEDNNYTFTITPNTTAAIGNARIIQLNYPEDYTLTDDTFNYISQGTIAGTNGIYYRYTGSNNSIRVFNLDSGSTVVSSITLSNNLHDLAADSNNIIVGERFWTNPSGFTVGRIYVYNHSGVLQHTIENPDQGTESTSTIYGGFGSYISSNGTYLLASNPEYPSSTTDNGRAYIYTLSDGNLFRTITAPADITAFGFHSDINSQYVVIGSNSNNTTTGMNAIMLYRISDGNQMWRYDSVIDAGTPENTTTYIGRLGIKMNQDYVFASTQALNSTDTSADIKAWSVTSGTISYIISKPDASHVNFVPRAVSDDYFVATSRNPTTDQQYVYIFDINSNMELVATITDPAWNSYVLNISVDIDNNNVLLITVPEINNSNFTGEVIKYDLAVNTALSFNNTTKVITLSGSRQTINSSLPYVLINPATGYTSNFELAYQATRSDNETSDVKTQTVNNA